MNPAHRQHPWSVRFDWGQTGASAVGEGADVAVVVDVLSFTTTLSVAADRGVDVFPYRWRDDGAAAFAAEHDAVLAVGRREAGVGAVSLSPGSIRSAAGLERLVLPSPNGSSIAHSLAGATGLCIGACLRNASAVADWMATHHRDGAAVAVIAAGERWPDGSLRPAVEDLWGAGAVIAALLARRPELTASPEAEVATAAWHSVADRIRSALAECASGRELSEGGFAQDVAVAAEVDASRSVPILANGRFVNRS